MAQIETRQPISGQILEDMSPLRLSMYDRIIPDLLLDSSPQRELQNAGDPFKDEDSENGVAFKEEPE